MSNWIRFSYVATGSLMALALVALFATQVSPAAAPPDGAVKIGVIDTEKILLSSATGKAALASLKKAQETAEDEVRMMQNEIKDLQNKIQNGRQSLSQDQLAQLQKQLDDKIIALRRKQDDATRDLNKKRDEVLGEIDVRVMPVINQIGKDLGYTLVFRKFESGLIYADEATDITALVIQRLDTGGTGLPSPTRSAAPGSSLTPAASGNVGIGTTNPVFDANNARFLAVDGGPGSFAEIGAGGNQTTPRGYLGTFAFFNSNIAGTEKRNAAILGSNDGAINSGSISFFTANSGSLTEKMRVGANGRVGIGTGAPTDTLSVNGTASKTDGGSWAVFSDERLKNIKGDFNAGLEAVMRLQPLRYEYRRDNALGLKSEGEHVGFGAQAVRQVIPEAVTRTDNGYLQVNNDPIIWAMLNAIKEQQKEIEQLKGQVQDGRQKAAARLKR